MYIASKQKQSHLLSLKVNVLYDVSSVILHVKRQSTNKLTDKQQDLNENVPLIFWSEGETLLGIVGLSKT